MRSRSYEALVQLEGILEARHQQLMSDGLLAPPPLSAASSFIGGDDAVEARRAASELGRDSDGDGFDDHRGVGMTDIQAEIRKMHRSLRRHRTQPTASTVHMHTHERL